MASLWHSGFARRVAASIVTLAFALATGAWAREPAPAVDAAQLPREARATLALIRRGGPFPYERDGVVFGNYERRLPAQPRGYYREYTVPTPGAGHRGARRIVAGGCEPAGGRPRAPERWTAPCAAGEYWYTDDHYRTFRRIHE